MRAEGFGDLPDPFAFSLMDHRRRLNGVIPESRFDLRDGDFRIGLRLVLLIADRSILRDSVFPWARRSG